MNVQDDCLDDLRRQIDEIDKKILSMLSKRRDIILEIGSLKQDRCKDVFDPGREKVLFEKIETQAESLGLDKKFIKELYTVILGWSKDLQKDILIQRDDLKDDDCVSGN